jgi:DNA-directed RNA polymerase subunit RPC12/RpoP
VIKDGTVIYRCLVCFEEYALSDTDTLMIDELLQESNNIHRYHNYIQNAYADSIVELAEKKCTNKSCKETIMHVIKIAQNGQSLYVCPTCKNQFN